MIQCPLKSRPVTPKIHSKQQTGSPCSVDVPRPVTCLFSGSSFTVAFLFLTGGSRSGGLASGTSSLLIKLDPVQHINIAKVFTRVSSLLQSTTSNSMHSVWLALQQPSAAVHASLVLLRTAFVFSPRLPRRPLCPGLSGDVPRGLRAGRHGASADGVLHAA